MALVLRDLFTAYEQTFIDITQTDELPFYRFDRDAAHRETLISLPQTACAT
jgi:hypothetical protein